MKPIYNARTTNIILMTLIFLGIVAGTVFYTAFTSNKSQNKDYYAPYAEDGEGFIGKTNELFKELLKKSVGTIDAVNLEDLNRKYPAFKFEIDEMLIATELSIWDIRLVGLNEDSIPEKYRGFYEGSDLRVFLTKQKQNLATKIFHISIRKNGKTGHITINKVEMINNLHNINFSSNTWDGEILGNLLNPIDNNETAARYLIYGNAILPIRIQQRHELVAPFHAIFLLHDKQGKGIFNSGRKVIDLYEYYDKIYKKNNRLRISFNQNNENEYLYIQLLKDTIYINADGSLTITIISNNKTESMTFSGRAQNDKPIGFSHDSEILRILVEENNRKIAEFQLAKQNPLKKLAYNVETNKGKTRVKIDPKYADIFTHQVVTTFLDNIKNDENSLNIIPLSIDPIFSKALEKELEEYGKSFTHTRDGVGAGEYFEISMCVINTATGEIIAAPYYVYSKKEKTNEQKMATRNPSMVRRYIGSCFKPIMTLASLQLYPQLIDLKTGNGSEITEAPIKRTIPGTGQYVLDRNGKEIFDTKILGCPIQNTFSGYNSGQYTIENDMKRYLAVSNNVFPVVLAMYSFTDFSGANPLNTRDLKNYITLQNENRNSSISLLNPTFDNTRLFRPNDTDYPYSVNQSNFAKILSTLYTTFTEEIINDTDAEYIPTRYLNRFLKDSLYFPLISPDITNMNYYRWDYGGSSLKGEIVPWVLGQGTNEWSPLLFAEAWARMMTKFPIKLSYIHSKDTAIVYENKKLLFEEIPNYFDVNKRDRYNVWNTFLDSFLEAQQYESSSSTLNSVYSRVIAISDSLIIFGKTGTTHEFERPDEESTEYIGDLAYKIGLYTFSLMTENQFENLKNFTNTPNTKVPNAGITCVIRIVHSYRKDGTPPRIDQNISSTNARDFLLKKRKESSESDERLRKIIFYTDELLK